VTAEGDQVIRLWNIADRKKSREFAWNKTWIKVMDVSPDGTVLALGGREGVVRLLNTSTGAEVCPQPGHERGVLSVTVSTDSRIAATTGLDRTIRIWDLEKARESRVITCDGHLNDCALAPDRKSLLAGVNRGYDPDRASLHLWNVTSGKVATGGVRHGVAGHHDQVTALAVVAGGRRLVSASRDASAIQDLVNARHLLASRRRFAVL